MTHDDAILTVAVFLAVCVFFVGMGWLALALIDHVVKTWRDDLDDEQAANLMVSEGGKEPMEFRHVQRLPDEKLK